MVQCQCLVLINYPRLLGEFYSFYFFSLPIKNLIAIPNPLARIYFRLVSIRSPCNFWDQ